MKKNYFFLCLLIGTGILVGFSEKSAIFVQTWKASGHFLNQAGSPGGKTGAPGDANCTQCHAGTVQSGAGFNLVTFSQNGNPVSDYIPGQTYMVTVSLGNNNPKNGFEILPLTPTNSMAGSLVITDNTNTKTIFISGKTRVTHKLAGTALSSWQFSWTAPSTDVGTVTFYLATNQTNSSNSDSGDIIRTSQHSIGTLASLKEENKLSIKTRYNTALNTIELDLNSPMDGKAFFNLVDLNGRSVFTENLPHINMGESAFSVKLNDGLHAGMYFVHFSVGNTIISEQLFISK